MVFDNSDPESPSTWQSVKNHLPIALIGGGAAVAFVGLHSAPPIVGLTALGHVALGLVLLLTARLRRRPATAEEVGR